MATRDELVVVLRERYARSGRVEGVAFWMSLRR